MQFVAVQAGHAEIGEEQVDWPGMLGSYGQSFEAIHSLEHAISLLLEKMPDCGPDGRLVVGHQNRQPAWIRRRAGACLETMPGSHG
jgi:hypothetical protein